jgi:hypothetical protein
LAIFPACFVISSFVWRTTCPPHTMPRKNWNILLLNRSLTMCTTKSATGKNGMFFDVLSSLGAASTHLSGSSASFPSYPLPKSLGPLSSYFAIPIYTIGSHCDLNPTSLGDLMRPSE